MKKSKVTPFILIPLAVVTLAGCAKVSDGSSKEEDTSLAQYKVSEVEWNNFWQANYPFHIANNYKATMNFAYSTGDVEALTMLIDGTKCKFTTPQYVAYLEVLENKQIKTYSYYSNSWHASIGTSNMADEYFKYFTGYFDYSKFSFDESSKSYKRASANIPIMGDITDLVVQFNNKKASSYSFKGNAPVGSTKGATGSISGEFTYGGQIVSLPQVDPDKPHIHTFSDEWASDETNHWHDATCEHYGEVFDGLEEHYDNNHDYYCDMCGKFLKESADDKFTFSISLKSGKKTFFVGNTDEIAINENNFEKNNLIYLFQSTDNSVATIDQTGKIAFVGPGKVNFIVSESFSEKSKQLPTDITVYSKDIAPANGFFDYTYKNTVQHFDTRAEITSKLEKYALDSHLGGIPLYEDNGYVKFSNRVQVPTPGWITDYGFGILTEGRIEGELAGETNADYKRFYHDYITKDPLTLNQFRESLNKIEYANHISSAFWEKRLINSRNGYEYRPILAADTVKKPILNSEGEIVSYETEATPNNAPIPMEPQNDLKNYKKWRIYVKTDGYDVPLKYHTNSTKESIFDGRGVSLEDYEFIFKLLLTGSNPLPEGACLAREKNPGIKGALDYYEATQNVDDIETINKIWNSFVSNDKIGIKVGRDDNGAPYIDINTITAIDSFTAMTEFSKKIFSPLPEDFFVGSNSFGRKGKDSKLRETAETYGTFDGGNQSILDTTLCVGPYKLEHYDKNQLIVFERNDDWFEHTRSFGNMYSIPGVCYRVIDTSSDSEKIYHLFYEGMLDYAEVPLTKIEIERGAPGVYQLGEGEVVKLNVNSCTQEQWDERFGPNGTIMNNCNWKVKPWMSNSNFLDGIFYSINRIDYAKKRGKTPSINYFGNGYLSNPLIGEMYNVTQHHKDAISACNSIDDHGYSNYGYDFEKAKDCFRNAIAELIRENKIVLGTKENPLEIDVSLMVDYAIDAHYFGDDLKTYLEKAFNDESVCNGKVVLNVMIENSNGLIYSEALMKGQFDLSFGNIEGNHYDPIILMELMKSDNSSSWTINWGADTSIVDQSNPIIFNEKLWSFDGLWEVACYSGIVQNGVIVEAVSKCYQTTPHQIVSGVVSGKEINDLSGFNKDNEAIDPNYDGYQIEIPLEFISVPGVEFYFHELEINALGFGSVLIEDAAYDEARKVIVAKVSKELCEEIDEAIFSFYKNRDIDFTREENKWMTHPFRQDKYNEIWNYRVHYKMSLPSGLSYINSVNVKINKAA